MLCAKINDQWMPGVMTDHDNVSGQIERVIAEIRRVNYWTFNSNGVSVCPLNQSQ